MAEAEQCDFRFGQLEAVVAAATLAELGATSKWLLWTR
jgi:hypothetical protein